MQKQSTYDCFYYVYMFDDRKYRKLCKTNKKADRTLLKRQCYVLDSEGHRIHLGEQKGVFRLNVLRSIQEELANYCKHLRPQLKMFDKDASSSVETKYYTLYYERYDKGIYEYGQPTAKTNKKGEASQLGLFSSFQDENVYKISNAWDVFEVELNNTYKLPIRERVLLHLEVLRLCRKGVNINIACKQVFESNKIELR